MAEQIVEFIFPKKISTNDIYSGVHWTTRKKDKELYLWSFLTVSGKIMPVKSCELEFEFLFKGRPLDCDNCSYMVKLIIDCLRFYGKIKDDTPEYIPSIKIISKKASKNSVILKIFG